MNHTNNGAASFIKNDFLVLSLHSTKGDIKISIIYFISILALFIFPCSGFLKFSYNFYFRFTVSMSKFITWVYCMVLSFGV